MRSRVVHLDTYSVNWDNSALHIPAMRGTLDATVPADPNSSKPAKFTVLVVPGVEKETLGVLASLQGDPNNDPKRLSANWSPRLPSTSTGLTSRPATQSAHPCT